MGKYYNGKHPCAGCGISGEEKPRYGKNNLCQQCNRALELGRYVKTDAESYGSISLAWHNFQNVTLRDFKKPYPDGYEKMPPGIRVWYESDGFGEQYNGSSKHLLKAFEAFLQELDMGRKDKYEFELNMEEADRSHYYTLPASAIKPLFEFITALGYYATRLKTKYFEEGKQLLINLNNGEITLKDFEERKA